MKTPLYRHERDRATPGVPFVAARALASTAIDVHTPAALTRGGPYGRASRLVEQGLGASMAAREAAKQGKGHVGELVQAVTQTVASALVDAEHTVGINAIANDRLVDIEVMARGTRVAAHQVKVGNPQYVSRSLRGRSYGSVIVNAESFDAVRASVDETLVSLSERLSFEGVDSEVLRADECTTRTISSLERMLLGQLPVGPLAVLAESVSAGTKDGAVSLVVELAASIGHSLLTGEALDLPTAIANAALRAGKAAARTTLQTHMLLTRFLERAAPEYSAHVLRRVAAGTIVAGAIAQVAVETAIDLWRVLQGRMTFEGLLRRFGVHAFSAAGGTLGAGAALVLTRGMHPFLQLLAVLGLGYFGARFGGAIGEELFLGPSHALALAGVASASR